MASVDTWAPSRRMQAAAAAEQSRVEHELERLLERKERLTRELDLIQATYEGLEGELATLRRLSEGSGLAGDARRSPRLRVVPRGGEARVNTGEIGPTILRGSRIRETAAQTLAATSQPDQAVHYRTWFELLRREGFLPAGKDPLATFLTQIARSPVIRRSTAPGMYSLDFDAVRRESARLAEVEAQLQAADTLDATATVADITLARERRSMLTTQLAAVRRRYAEILRSLETPGT